VRALGDDVPEEKPMVDDTMKVQEGSTALRHVGGHHPSIGK